MSAAELEGAAQDDLLSAYDFELPDAQIAQQPAAERSASRLLRIERQTGTLSHHIFRELPQLLRPGDVLVFNDTRVIPARLIGRRSSGGRAEVLLLKQLGPATAETLRYGQLWEAIAQPSARLKPGAPIELGPDLLAFTVERRAEAWLFRLEASIPVMDAIEANGQLPLPPYILRAEGPRSLDEQRYQTVYAATPGSAAAPTAGLHFSKDLLAELNSHGIELHRLTLHVGLGTFSPVRAENLGDHRMHSESYVVTPALWSALGSAKTEHRRVIAVGTTSVRTLEAVYRTLTEGESPASLDEHGWPTLKTPLMGETDIFIRPGFAFRVVDAIITNFHLPRSSLLILVSAFAGRERILASYRSAVQEGYRFFSYGDATLME